MKFLHAFSCGKILLIQFKILLVITRYYFQCSWKNMEMYNVYTFSCCFMTQWRRNKKNFPHPWKINIFFVIILIFFSGWEKQRSCVTHEIKYAWIPRSLVLGCGPSSKTFYWIVGEKVFDIATIFSVLMVIDSGSQRGGGGYVMVINH